MRDACPCFNILFMACGIGAARCKHNLAGLSMQTIKALFDSWKENIRPAVVAQHGANDYAALAESWSDYTDAECKDGNITDLQYHYCPAFDDAMPDDDCVFLLERMGVEFDKTRIKVRTDRAGDWGADASHWVVTVKRVGTGPGKVFAVEYSMGSAFRGAPKGADVFACLLSDSASADNTFEAWADEYGYDTDSRKAEGMYRACKETLSKLESMFKTSELSDLREVFADR
jgi:hypothetical protein